MAQQRIMIMAQIAVEAPPPQETADGNGWLVPSWVAAVRSTADRLEAELSRAPGRGQAAYAVEQEIIENAIRVARESADRPSLKGGTLWWLFRPFRRIADWWTGYYDDEAWAAVHRANNTLLTIEADAVVKAQLADIAATVTTALDPDDLRVKDYLKTLELLAPAGRVITDRDREELRGIKQACDSAADSGHADARAFRNNLTLAAVVLAVVLAVVAIVGRADPGFRDIFATSKSAPGGWFVLELELIASLSGLTGAVLSLRNYTGFQYSYGLSFVQALLKGSTGAATGLFGVLLVKSGVVGSLTLHSPAAYFAVAIVFGYAQYLFTRLVDQEAKSVLKSAGSRNDTKVTAQPPRGATPPDLLTIDPAQCPQVTGSDHKDGDRAGGTAVRVAGSGLAAASEVYFGDGAAPNVTIDSDSQLVVVSPPGTGTVHIRVAAPAGVSPLSAAAQFSYT